MTCLFKKVYIYTFESVVKNIIEKKICYHCGEFCDDELIKYAGKSFCCYACKNVYQIISGNNLDEFYRLNKNSGLKSKKKSNFDFLDSKDVLEKVLNFKDDTLCKIRIHIPEIYCSSCIWLLENISQLDSAIVKSTVNFARKDLFIDFNPKETSLREIAELLVSLGYNPDFNHDFKEDRKSTYNTLYIQLALAGFAFGNIMILSFPEYLDKSFTESEFRKVFSYLSFVFALPVLLYSAKNYFKSAYQNIRSKQITIDLPISIGILSLFFRSTIDIFWFDTAGYFDSFSGFVFFILLGKLYQTKMFEHLSFEKQFKSLLPISVERRKNNVYEYILIENLKRGDVFRLRHNEIVPCDSILRKKSKQFDYSFVSGESNIVEKNMGLMIYSGARLRNQSAEFTVQKEVDKSYLVQLWSDANQHKRSQKHLTLVDQLSFRFTVAILTIAFLVFIATLPLGLNEALNRLSSVLIVACPCALALTIPFTYGTVSTVLSRNGFFFKNILYLELMNRVKNFVFDKTGTLTRTGSGQVRSFIIDDTYQNEISFILSHSNHPLAKQIVAAYPVVQNFEIIDFEEIAAKGLRGKISDRNFIIGSKLFLEENGIFVRKQKLEGTHVYVAIEKQLVGFYSISLSLRNGISELFYYLENNPQFEYYLLSGDTDQDKLLFKDIFKDPKRIHFEQSPSDKVGFIKSLNKDTVMFGDGMNDASALQQSLVGISVVEENNQFSPSSDAILKADKFHKLADFLDLIKSAKTIILISIIFSLIYNLIGLYFAATGYLTPLFSAVLMPLSSVTIISIAVLSILLKSKRLELN